MQNVNPMRFEIGKLIPIHFIDAALVELDIMRCIYYGGSYYLQLFSLLAKRERQ